MCLFNTGKKPDDPKLPPERAQMKMPDQGAVQAQAARRTKDRMRAAGSTVLTSGSGVTNAAPTTRKTLLG